MSYLPEADNGLKLHNSRTRRAYMTLFYGNLKKRAVNVVLAFNKWILVKSRVIWTVLGSHTLDQDMDPLLKWKILKFLKICQLIYQSTQNFMLISKMYNFIYLFWIFHELFVKNCHFGPGPGFLWITLESLKICI